MNFSKYPSIEQFRNVVKAVERIAKSTYDPETNDWVYDMTKVAPTLTFTGTVKAHGTNAGIYIDSKGGYNAQKRSSALGDGHFGFYEWMSTAAVTRSLSFTRTALITTYPILEGRDFVIYGEWCGGNIQKGVSISGLDKMFIVFGV